VTVERLIELRGIPTVLVTVATAETEQANPPRALHPEGFAPGASLGRPDAALQKRIVLDALDLVVHPVLPGTIVVRRYD
jgi:hypothetical protein